MKNLISYERVQYLQLGVTNLMCILVKYCKHGLENYD